MTNVEMKVEDNTLIINVDLSKTGAPSASGKSIIVASTRGNQPLPEPCSDVKVGLNMFRSR